MKAMPWIVAGLGVGIAAYVVADRLAPAYADLGNVVENASGKLSLWGWKERLLGKGKGVAGRVKEQTGKVLHNEHLVAEGLQDRIVGKVDGAAGYASVRAGEALHVMDR